MLLNLSSLEKMLSSDPTFKVGCVVDTNVIFAHYYPLDYYNEWAESVFKALHQLEIPIFTNLNVRSEFIELSRRVLIPEGLVDFYEASTSPLADELEAALKSLRTRKKKANDEERTFKLSDSEIKRFKDIFDSLPSSFEVSGWEAFCRDYFSPYILPIWDEAVKQSKVNFLGTREIESKQYFDKHPSWDDMMRIVASSGIGTSDAMIINLFLQSKIPIMITADKDVKQTLLKIASEGKLILAP